MDFFLIENVFFTEHVLFPLPSTASHYGTTIKHHCSIHLMSSTKYNGKLYYGF